MIKDIWEESSYKDALAAMAEKSLMRRMVKKVLINRFGVLDSEMLAEVDKADTATCDDIISHIVTDTLEQVKMRLREASEIED